MELDFKPVYSLSQHFFDESISTVMSVIHVILVLTSLLLLNHMMLMSYDVQFITLCQGFALQPRKIKIP